MIERPNLFIATQLYFPASSFVTPKISNIAKPSANVCTYFDVVGSGKPFFSQNISQSSDNNEHVNLTDEVFSVTVRSLISVVNVGLSSECDES